MEYIRALTLAGGVTQQEDAETVATIKRALALMPDLPYTRAIENALGLGEFQAALLSKRRKSYIEKHGMSERTLIRYEVRGASMLLYYIEKVAAGLGSNADDPAELRRRIQELEIVNEALRGKLAGQGDTDV
jgi:hypothetical protein